MATHIRVDLISIVLDSLSFDVIINVMNVHVTILVCHCNQDAKQSCEGEKNLMKSLISALVLADA